MFLHITSCLNPCSPAAVLSWIASCIPWHGRVLGHNDDVVSAGGMCDCGVTVPSVARVAPRDLSAAHGQLAADDLSIIVDNERCKQASALARCHRTEEQIIFLPTCAVKSHF